LAVLAFAATFAAASAFAQQPQRISGSIDKIDSSTVVIKQGEGPEATVKLTDNVQVFAVAKATLADVKVGSFIGVGAMPQPDGSQKAIQVTIFAESQRGTGEGFRPWDRPGTTMTNATVDTTVASVDGQVLTVKYKDGEKKIVIGADAVIRAYIPTGKSELKPGALVSVFRPDKLPDGTFQTSRINVGRDGLTP
jgi:hypothetical protein